MSDREYHRSLPNTSPPQPPSQRTYYEYNQNLSTFPEEYDNRDQIVTMATPSPSMNRPAFKKE
ncbi:MAG: hypothetical protein MMC23_009751 [Stictis urceolatum]|nr:hypothetical protein [Stictis urceolata]